MCAGCAWNGELAESRHGLVINDPTLDVEYAVTIGRKLTLHDGGRPAPRQPGMHPVAFAILCAIGGAVVFGLVLLAVTHADGFIKALLILISITFWIYLVRLADDARPRG